MNRLKEIPVAFLLVCLSTGMIFAGAEWFCRRMLDREYAEALVAIRTQPELHAESYRQLFAYHPLYGFNIRPSSEIPGVEYNAQGFRGPSLSMEKPPGIKRVVLMGDSRVWGWGIGDESTISTQLQPPQRALFAA